MRRYKVRMKGRKGKRVRRKFNKGVHRTKKANLRRGTMRGGIRF